MSCLRCTRAWPRPVNDERDGGGSELGWSARQHASLLAVASRFLLACHLAARSCGCPCGGRELRAAARPPRLSSERGRRAEEEDASLSPAAHPLSLPVRLLVNTKAEPRLLFSLSRRPSDRATSRARLPPPPSSSSSADPPRRNATRPRPEPRSDTLPERSTRCFRTASAAAAAAGQPYT